MFRLDSEPPDRGEGECPNCAHNRAYAVAYDFFEDFCEGEEVGSWRKYLISSSILSEAAILLADHAWEAASGEMCPRHLQQARDMDAELQRDSRREEGL